MPLPKPADVLLSLFLAAPPPVLGDNGLSGAEVYAQSCAMCHAKGTGGAPRPGEADAWRSRLAVGRADLLLSVLRGKGAMPPKGGNASLTTREVNAALEHMLSSHAR